MLFNSYNFIFAFLPAFLLSYFLIDSKYKNAVVLVYSILYYIIGNIGQPLFIFILIIMTFINYIFTYLIYLNKRNGKFVKIVFTTSIIFNVLVLLLFKSEIITKQLPLGISFYIFHFISINTDTFKSLKINSRAKHDKSFVNYITYILFFPKLLSGPITRYDNLKSINSGNGFDLYSFINGIYLFSIGLDLKCLLSENISYIINQINVFGFESISILTAWIGMYSYTMCLYFDFAGYSLMAIGIAKMIGIDLPENFNLPFAAKSISEFWRRWHITLGAFFRDYVYIPLGGNFGNKNLFRQSINIIIVWLITGLWHGMKVNYMLWALISCVLIILEKLFLNKVYKKSSLLGRVIVILLMPFAFLIFSIENLSMLKTFISRLYDFSSIYNSRDLIVIIKQYAKTFILGVAFMTPFPKLLLKKVSQNKILMIVVSIALIISSCFMISISENDTFKYFAF